jgi:hypothetical protein
LANIRQFEALKFQLHLWGRIIWPKEDEKEKRKFDHLLGPVGAVLGVFAELANVLQRVLPKTWLLMLVLGLFAVTLGLCYSRVTKVPGDSEDQRTQEAKIEVGTKCRSCTAFRICFFLLLAVFILDKTMNFKLDEILTGEAKIENQLDGLKPHDPREILAKSGALWTVDAFFDAIRRGDDTNVKLFLVGRMTTDVPDSQGRPLPVILALNTTSAPAMLDLLAGAGLDVNHSYQIAGALRPQRMTLLSRAIESGSAPLVEALIKHHVDVNSPIQTFGAMGLTRDTYPLASAIYWKRLEIAELLLDAGADPAVGDYAAYREAQALREKSTGDLELSGRLNSLMVRLGPHGAAGARIESELRLQGIEQQLTQVALASLRTLPGSPERRKLDAEYDQLQIERTKLRNALSAAGKQ